MSERMSKSTLFLRLRLLLGALVILAAAQAFNGGLSISTLEKLYSGSIVSGFEVVANDFLLKLQAAVRFGKPLDKFFGMDKAMAELKADLPELDNIMVAMPDGLVVHSYRDYAQGLTLQQRLGLDLAKVLDSAPGQGSLVLKTSGQRHLLLQLHKEQELAGLVVFSFPESLIQERVRRAMQANLVILAQVTLVAALLLILGLRFLVRLEAGVAKRRLFVVLLLVVGGAQLVYALMNMNMFRGNYVEVTRDKSEMLGSLVCRDVEFLLNKGVRLERLVKIEERFREIIKATPEIKAIEILAVDGRVLNRGELSGAVAVPEVKRDPERLDRYHDILLPLMHSEAGVPYVVGAMLIQLDRATIQLKVRDILLDSLTVTLISLLFVVELLLFLLLSIRRTLERSVVGASSPAAGGNGESAYQLGRPAAFVMVFMWALPSSFLPLYMQTLYQPMWGLAKDVALGLPISVEMFCALGAALACGVITDRKGWHLPFITGVVVLSLAGLFSGLAGTGQEFILARGITGLGYGLAWMAIQGFIFTHSTPDTRARGTANLVAGIISGQICGTAVGAMLAERIGYASVFLLSASLAVLPLLFVLLFMRPWMHKPQGPRRDSLHPGELMGLLRNRTYFAVLFLSLMPFSLCEVGLLFFAVPIYLNQMGLSSSNIGRVLMIYGLSVVYLAPWISRFVDRADHKKLFIVLGGITGGLGLMSLYLFEGFVAVLVAVFLLGMAGSLSGSARFALALKLPVIKRVGVGKAMSVQRAADKLGQMLGPLILGLLMARVGIGNGVALVGLLFFVATLLFALTAREGGEESAT